MRIYDTSSISSFSRAPWKGPSLEFIQTAYKEQLYTLATSIMQQNSAVYNPALPSIITGSLTFDGTNYNFTNGTLLSGNELFQFDAQSVAFSGGLLLRYEVITTYDTADPTTFSDLTSHNVHQIRKVQFSMGTIFGPFYTMTGYQQLNKLALDSDMTIQKQLTSVTPWSLVPSFVNWTSYCNFTKDGMGNISFRKFFEYNNSPTSPIGLTAGIIPAGSTPVITGHYITRAQVGGSPYPCYISIAATGWITIEAIPGIATITYGDTIQLDNITYLNY